MDTLTRDGEVGAASPLRLADLHDELERLLRHYVEFQTSGHAMLVACWIANTYTYEAFQYCGYLALRSSQPACGKSRLLRIIAMCSKGIPKVMTVPTAAALFRSERQVIILDEADRLTNRDKEMQGALVAILNVGFEKGGVVPRTERAGGKGEKFAVKEFPVYGPKAFAGVEKLTDTLADRTFIIPLKPAVRRTPRLNERRLGDAPAKIREALQAWADRERKAISGTYDTLPDEVPELVGLDDRFQDIAEPLLVLAKLADEERPDGPLVVPRLLEGIRAAAKRRESRDRSLPPKALYEIVEVLLGASDKRFIPSHSLLEECCRHEEFSLIKSTKGLASKLKRFGLCPQESPDGKCRGYWLTKEWLDEHRGSVA